MAHYNESEPLLSSSVAGPSRSTTSRDDMASAAAAHDASRSGEAYNAPKPVKSTMFGFLPHTKRQNDTEVTEEAADVAVIDPSATVDPQTGAVIHKKSREERLFVARLDVFLLLYACISQVLKYLDQNNIRNAYVSGMQEDLNLHGNEYNLFDTFFYIGYAVFLIPSQIVITRVRPHLWLPALEFCWGMVTIGLSKVNSAKQIYILRAFCGAFEASAYPGALMLLMSWYTPREIAFRIGFYHSCQSIGSMLSGALQAAIYTNLNGHHGMAGWRWMFVIDGVVTVFFALAGFVLIPDFPSNPNPWSLWLRPRHIELARERTIQFRRSDNKKFTWTTIKRTVKQPLIYFFCVLYPGSVLAQQGYSYFTLFLKSLKHPDGSSVWSVAAVNAIPIAGGAITVVMVWVWAYISDVCQTRWLVVVAQAIIGIIPCIIMSIWTVPLSAKYFAYFCTYISLATAPPIFAWMSDLSPHDAEQRAFILGFTIAFYYAVSAWSNVLIWPAGEAPHYSHAWQSSIALWLVVILAACALRFLELRYIRPRNQRIAADKFEDIVDAAKGASVDDAATVGHADDQTVADVEDGKDAKHKDGAADTTVVVAEMTDDSPRSERRRL